ncbi:MAG TPA: hypothetical protein ENI20_10595 [Bacteroides sp.]|nr:hypothetical protein [Bacteroides sp.]
MDYNFGKFLRNVGKHCITKQDFVDMANKEIYKRRFVYLKPPALFHQQSYIKRLEGTVFVAENGQFKDMDIFNNHVAELLDRLA